MSSIDGKETNRKLNAEDIKSLLSESDNFNKLTVLDLKILKIDIETLIVVIISIILWVSLWYFFDIFRIISYAETFFILYLVIIVINLINSATDVPDVESERMQQTSQQSFIQGGIAVFILAFVFLNNMGLEQGVMTETYRILILSMLVSCVSIIIINVKNDSINIRFVRKIQQMLYNQGLILFLLALYMLYRYKTSLSVVQQQRRQ